MTSSGKEALTLPPLPAAFAVTRSALHRVAEEVVAPARKPDNEIALEATPGGFGTPWFVDQDVRQRVRVDGTDLVYEREGDVRKVALDGAAADAADALARWYELGDEVLRRLVAGAGDADEPSGVHLWPEHFDIAIELGSEAAGLRANYGFSPGDDDHPEPYVYVGPWTAEVEGELWRATGFRGAELGYAELQASPDPAAAALDFCLRRKEALMSRGEETR